MPRPHPPEFRQRAVELARLGEKSTAQIAADLGISDSCLRNWIRQADVPPSLRKARAAAGESAWLDALPELVSEMACAWSLATCRSCDGFGMNALVVEATTADGTAVVLKLAPPSDAEKLALEATVLRLADGHGCVRLLDADIDRRALLLERLGPSMYDLGVPRRRRHELLLETAEHMWRPVDPSVRLQRGSERARWTIERLKHVWEQSDRACSEPVLVDAIACAERRADAHDDTRAVLMSRRPTRVERAASRRWHVQAHRPRRRHGGARVRPRRPHAQRAG